MDTSSITAVPKILRGPSVHLQISSGTHHLGSQWEFPSPLVPLGRPVPWNLRSCGLKVVHKNHIVSLS